MANRNQLINIPLNGQLCLNKTKVDIEQFSGWNKINSPIYGGCLSPLNQKKSDVKGAYWDDDGNYYNAKADGLYKNEELVMEYQSSDVTITDIYESETEKILAIRGDKKIVLLKNVKYTGTSNPTVRFYENDNLYYDIEYDEVKMLDFYIDQSGKMYYLSITDTSYVYLYVIFCFGEVFDVEYIPISLGTNVLKAPFIKAYSISEYYSLVTVYAQSFDNYRYGNGLTAESSSSEKLFANVLVYLKSADKLGMIRDINISIYQNNLTNIAVNPSCFTEEGIICLYPADISGTTLTYLGINSFATVSPTQNKVELWARSFYTVPCKSGITKIDDVVFTMNKNFFRVVYTHKVFTAGNREKAHMIVDPRQTYGSNYDQRLNYFFYNCGTTAQDKNENISPTSYPCSSFEVLINNNLPSNISYKNKIFKDWFQIDSDFRITSTDTALYFKDTDGIIHKCTVETVTPKIKEVIDGRYIITNTTGNYCFDIKTGDVKVPFSDYNGRLVRIGTREDTDYANDYILGAAINPKYEITEDSICSAIFPALIYYGLSIRYLSFPKDVDVFYSKLTENTAAVYKFTDTGLINNYIVYNSWTPPRKYKETLAGAVYPIETNGTVQLNPNANSKFIQTYNNHDLIINENVTYALNYYNGKLILLYSMLSAIENLQNVFVLNTSTYGISKDKLFAMNYSNGIAELGEVIVNIRGLQYVGALPQRAVFYSPRNRCLYGFTGDANLFKFVEASDITAVYKTWYDTATQAIYFSTNAGLYVMTEEFMYNMPLNPDEVFFFTDGKLAMNFNDDNEATTFMSYEKLDEHYKTINIKLETKFYGEGRNLPGVVDCWYIRFYNNGIKEGGTIKLRASALTDKGAVGETKEVILLPSSWDKETDSFYLRFQPHLQKGIGVCLEIESPFAIMDINCGYTGFDGAAQVTQNNV